VRTDTLSTSPFTRDQLAAFDWIRRESDQQVDFVFGNDTPDREQWMVILAERGNRYTPYTPYFEASMPPGTIRLNGPVPNQQYFVYQGSGEDPYADDPAYAVVFESGAVRVYELVER
jgi:hypothetical protein